VVIERIRSANPRAGGRERSDKGDVAHSELAEAKDAKSLYEGALVKDFK